VRQRDALPMLLARHPEQRRAVYRGYSLHESHGKLLLALAGGLAFGRRRPVLAALAATPWIDLYLDLSRISPRPLARSLLHLPVRLVLDGAELAVTLRGALRHRVPII
jgi:hypothetical protein